MADCARPNKLRIGQLITRRVPRHYPNLVRRVKPTTVVLVLELRDVTVKVLHAKMVVGSHVSTFEHRPELFYPVPACTRSLRALRLRAGDSTAVRLRASSVYTIAVSSVRPWTNSWSIDPSVHSTTAASTRLVSRSLTLATAALPTVPRLTRSFLSE